MGDSPLIKIPFGSPASTAVLSLLSAIIIAVISVETPGHPPSLPMDHAFKNCLINLTSGDNDRPLHGGEPLDKSKTEMDFFASRRETLNHHHVSLTGGECSKTSDSDVYIGLNLSMMNTSHTAKDYISLNTEEKLKTKVDRLTVENQMLRNKLSEANSDNDCLRMQLMAVMESRKFENNPDRETNNLDDKKPIVLRQFMDLGIGSVVYDDVQHTEEYSLADELQIHDLNNELEVVSTGVDHDSRNEKRASSSRLRDRCPDQESSMWNSNKVPRFSIPGENVDHQAVTEATMRKARVSVRIRSESNMVNDGCQWRKYGQKMAKGNPCPRAYYRCTMTGNCPVRKQVQRCAEDRTILVSTYEGNHNHALPPTAMAMSQTTSSAARMLLSGSMSSADSLMNANLLARPLLPCNSSIATISASAPFPTVTLDLTENPNASSLLQTPPNHLQLPVMANPNQSFQNPNDIFTQALLNQSRLQTQNPNLKGDSSESLTAASATIASNPNFTAALAAAITSIMGGSSSHTSESISNATTNTPNGSG